MKKRVNNKSTGRDYSYDKKYQSSPEQIKKRTERNAARAEIKKELDKYKAIPSTIEIEGETPLLKIGKPENWNFLLEGKDFEMKLDGKITWKI